MSTTVPDRARVLIVHMPKTVASVNEIMVMPMGLFPISRALRDFYQAHHGPSRPGFRTTALDEDEIMRAVERLRASGRRPGTKAASSD